MAYIDDVYSVVQIQPTGIEAFVRLSQNENGRRLYFAITGGEIPTGSTATLSGTKPDGVVYSKTGTISGNVVTILEDVQLTAAAGPWPAKLRILNGGNVVATGRIRFVIDKDPVAAGAVPSDSQLEGLVAEAAAYAEAAKDGAYYGSPLTASTVAGMTDKNRVYVYTGSESGYTAGNWYYWSGSAWTSGGVYNSQGIQTDKTLSVTGMAADAKSTGDALKAVQVETDKTLTQADVPADAKVVGDKLTALKADLSDISERKSTGNIFDPSYLVSSAGWTKDGEDYYGTAKQAADAFGTSPYYPVNCDPSKRYVLSFKAMTTNEGNNPGNGLVIVFVYGDDATNQIGLPNNTNEYTTFTFVSSDSTAQHGGITAIKFGYSNGGANVWHMKEITLNEGTTPIGYYGELTALDKEARAGLSILQDDFAEKTSNIRMPVINFQFDDGVAKDADIVSIFDDYDFKCGFAVPTNIDDLSPYVTYQGKGYEVISHSTDGTGMNDASVDSSVIEAKLKTSKETLENAGLKIRGFVTPNSIMNLKFRPLLRKYYDWADTISFGTYSGTINGTLQPYMVPVDGVYNGWRVSLQTTTLANAKLAVDKCIENYGCLTFYGHAWALDTDNNLTTANLTSLLNYIADKVDAGECACDIPSKAILNYFNVRNDDVLDGWINVSSTDAELDSRLSVAGWDMRYNPKTKIFAFSARLTATEAISGSFVLCKIPVHLVTNAFGSLIANESGKNMLFYNNGVLCQTSTWASGTSYRMSGFGIFDYVL